MEVPIQDITCAAATVDGCTVRQVRVTKMPSMLLHTHDRHNKTLFGIFLKQ